MSITYPKAQYVQDVINVKDFGAVGDGVADDTNELKAALAAAATVNVPVVVPGGTYLLSDDVVVPSGVHLIGNGIGVTVFKCAENWQNLPLITAGSGCVLRDFTVEETNASPTNAAKDQAGNIGVYVVSDSDVTIERVYSKGFNFPFAIRGASDVVLRECTASHGYAWGFEVDSSPQVIMRDCISYTNGYHGIKTQNEYAATCDGFVLDNFYAYDNGQRSTGAGGSESNGGSGISLYHGGYRYSVVNCRCDANYGSAFSQKGGGSDPVQGEGFISNCHFTGGITPFVGGAAHGIELGLGGGTGGSLLHISNCNTSNNAGDGIHIQAGFGITIDKCNSTGNTGNGVTLYHCTDVTIRGLTAFANQTMGMRLGYSNGGTYLSRRWNITDCTISGNYNDSLADWADPRTAATAKESDYGITTYSDSADIVFERCHVFNIAGTGQSISVNSGRTKFIDCRVYGAVRNAYQISSPSCELIGGVVQETDFSGSAYYGSIFVAAGDVKVSGVHFIQSGLTANSKCVLAIGTATISDCAYTNITNLVTSDTNGVADVLSTPVATADTTDATPEVIASFLTSSNRSYIVEATVLATETADHDETASYKLAGTFKNDGGTLTQVGATTTVHSTEDTAGWACAFNISSQTVQVVITGAAATAINWKCRLSWQELA